VDAAPATAGGIGVKLRPRRRRSALSWDDFIALLGHADANDGERFDEELGRIRDDGLGEELLDLDVAFLGALRPNAPEPGDPDPTPEERAAFAREHAPELLADVRLRDRVSAADLEPVLLVVAAEGPSAVAGIPLERQHELFTIAAAAELRRVAQEQGSTPERMARALVQAFALNSGR
jgi:hypothetical protein